MNRRTILALAVLSLLLILLLLVIVPTLNDDESSALPTSGQWMLTAPLRSTGANLLEDCLYSPPPFDLAFQDERVTQTDSDGDVREYLLAEPGLFVYEMLSEGAILRSLIRVISPEQVELEIRSDFEGDVLGCVYQLELVEE